MNDIIIKAKHVRREIIYFLSCVLIMEIVNAFSIYTYKGKWIELIMSIGYVCVATIALYIFIAIIRFMVYTVSKRLIRRKNKNK